MSLDLHKELNVVDGLIITSGERRQLEQMIAGGLTAANVTCSVWDGFRSTMERIAAWKQCFVDNADLCLQVKTAADIRRAKAEGKVGIILGWQNTSAFEDQIPFVRLFHELGVRIAQLTYNTQNLLGSGCYESRDSGLSDFGRQIIDEMNAVGILIDLSHVGPLTSEETVTYSKRPVCYTHVASRALKDHPRNKSDAQLRQLVDRGGFVGATFFTSFMRTGTEATIDDCLEVIEHMIGVAGEQNVGFGTDIRVNYPTWSPYWKHDSHPMIYWQNDKGYARELTSFISSTVRYPGGLTDYTGYPKFTAAMQARGWPPSRIRNVMGDNWIRFLDQAWSV
ncbi:MAG: membrane dipeptidase [Burkholderiaceae bacterium]